MSRLSTNTKTSDERLPNIAGNKIRRVLLFLLREGKKRAMASLRHDPLIVASFLHLWGRGCQGGLWRGFSGAEARFWFLGLYAALNRRSFTVVRAVEPLFPGRLGAEVPGFTVAGWGCGELPAAVGQGLRLEGSYDCG